MKTTGIPTSSQRSLKPSTIRAALAALGLLAAGAALLAPDAMAKDKVPSDKAPGKTATAKLPQLHGVVLALDGDILTIEPPKQTSKEPQKLTLAPDCVISLTPDKKGEAPAGKRDDLVPGVGVVLTLSADSATVEAVQVMGRHVHGVITAVDAASLTIQSKTKDGAKEETFTLTPDTAIILSHGKEKGAAKTGTAADLKVDMSVAIALSAVEKSSAREVSVQAVASPKPKGGK